MRILVAALLLASCAHHGPMARVDPNLVERLEAEKPGERARAAFELGQLGVAWDEELLSRQVDAEGRLVSRLAREHDDEVRDEIVAALGRVGRAKARRVLLDEIARGGPGQERAGWSLVHLYRRLRTIDASSDAKDLSRALSSPQSSVRAAVTAAIAEIQRPSIRPYLLRGLTDPDGLVRARAAQGLVKVATADDVPLLLRTIDDSDERAASAAALAIAELADRGVAPKLALDALLRALPDPATAPPGSPPIARPALVLTLANANLLTDELLPFWTRLVAREQLDAEDRLGCLAALAHDRAAARVELLPTCVEPTPLELAKHVARMYLETTPKRTKGAVEALLALPDDDKVRAAVASALGRYDEPRSRERLRALIADPDRFVRASAAESAALLHANELGPALLAQLPTLPLSADDVEPTMSILGALAVLKPAGFEDKVRPFLDATPAAVAFAARDALGPPAVVHPGRPRGPHDSDVLTATSVRLVTERGVVKIRLRADRAPKTVRNFVALVRDGFYDGLTFHRVVPGFVAQGGDPRGDGSGSSGALIPCEPNPMRYVQGVVGMALSGLDTGSSQFFIVLEPEPHLEGRYTAFGEVTEGMGAVRLLQPGDRIVHAQLE